jgi:hypothetical protein
MICIIRRPLKHGPKRRSGIVITRLALRDVPRCIGNDTCRRCCRLSIVFRPGQSKGILVTITMAAPLLLVGHARRHGIHEAQRGSITPGLSAPRLGQLLIVPLTLQLLRSFLRCLGLLLGSLFCFPNPPLIIQVGRIEELLA